MKQWLSRILIMCLKQWHPLINGNLVLMEIEVNFKGLFLISKFCKTLVQHVHIKRRLHIKEERLQLGIWIRSYYCSSYLWVLWKHCDSSSADLVLMGVGEKNGRVLFMNESLRYIMCFSFSSVTSQHVLDRAPLWAWVPGWGHSCNCPVMNWHEKKICFHFL